MLPAGIVWQIYVSKQFLYLVMYLISAAFVPLLPMCIASMMGVLITVVSSKFRRKNMVSLVFSFAILGGLLGIGIYRMQTGVSGESMGIILMEQVRRLYPLSAWFHYTDFLSLAETIGFWIISVLVFFIFVRIVASRYAMLNSMFCSAMRLHQAGKSALRSILHLKPCIGKRLGVISIPIFGY